MSTDSCQIPSWLDSHCHFDFQAFDSDRQEHWTFLQRMGCAGLIIPGVTASTWLNLIEVCNNQPWAYSLGLHPYFLDQHTTGDVEKLKRLCQVHSPVALGEFGLDFMLGESSFIEQLELCEQQLALAQELQLPVILHIRKAYDEVAAIVRRLGFNQGGVVHAFSGSYQQAQALIKLGFKLGIGGAISHSRARKLRRTVRDIPLSSIVLETDSPDMMPSFLSGERNSPISILLLAQLVARLKQCEFNEVIRFSNDNIRTVIPRLNQVIPL